MAHNLDSLTEKEKQTLRLLLAGHDAKSMARHLGLSVHTVNERLRDARRKLSVSSSKEAARLLREAEGPDPESVGDKPMGDAPAAAAGQQGSRPGATSLANPRNAWAVGGLVMLSFATAILALTGAPDAAPEGAAPQAADAPVAESGAASAARQWLALVDSAKWSESWAGTTKSFQSLNTVEAWRSASESARVPLGRLLSRRLTGDEGIPAPPNGYQLVRFRTDFANKAGAVETLTLAREDGQWRIVGYYIE